VTGVASCLLGLVPGNGTDDGVFLSGETVSCSLDVSLSLSSVVFALSSSVFLLARVDPCARTSQVTDGLDDGSLNGMVLASSLGRVGVLLRRHYRVCVYRVCWVDASLRVDVVGEGDEDRIIDLLIYP